MADENDTTTTPAAGDPAAAAPPASEETAPTEAPPAPEPAAAPADAPPADDPVAADEEALGEALMSAGEAVEEAAKHGWVRGSADGPVDLEPRLHPEEYSELHVDESGQPEETQPHNWTRGDDPVAAAKSLRESSYGSTGGPFPGHYDMAGSEGEYVLATDEQKLAQQIADQAGEPKLLSDEEAQARADADAEAKAAAEAAATGSPAPAEVPAEAPAAN